MKKIEHLKIWAGLFSSKPYIPNNLKNARGPLLMHISDTPDEIYKYVIRLAEALEPDYIIHTGDLVDNIKLGLLPQKIDKYRETLAYLIPQMEEVTGAEIYYVLGNHDNINVVKKLSKRGIVMLEGHIDIEGHDFYVNHYHRGENQGKYHLFGHSFSPKSYHKSETIGLNGLQEINIIDLSTEIIYNLPYPFGTNFHRKMETRSIGL